VTVSAEDDRALTELRTSLLGARPRPLGADEGEAAFQQHKILASEIHRAALLDRMSSETEGEAFVRYIRSHFPTRKRTRRDARLLWKEWRCALIKADSPRSEITVSHGQEKSKIHWKRGEDGRLNIALEGMWRDFERSVDNFIKYLRASEERRSVVLERFRGHTREVTLFRTSIGMGVGATVYSVPEAHSVTGSNPTSRGRS
jgi:hypothetical protein